MKRVRYEIITGYPGYRVGDDGSVWSRVYIKGQGGGLPPLILHGKHWKQLKPTKHKSGHLLVSLGRGNRFYVHVLVLEAFVGQCPEGLECRHVNNNPADNRRSNLCWGTSKENTADQRSAGTLIGGERHGMAKLTNKQVDELRELVNGGLSQREAGARFGIKQPHVCAIMKGKARTKSSHAGKGL